MFWTKNLLYPFVGEECFNSSISIVEEHSKDLIERVYFTFYSGKMIGRTSDTRMKDPTTLFNSFKGGFSHL